jgi:HAE1 family hydrophobic/amphiphilic exporter-1
VGRTLHSLVVALVLLGSSTAAPAVSAQQLSRAEAVALALAANPAVKLSLEQVALLEARITEARADALPDVSWTTRAFRSRDPGLLNSPNFDQFPEEFRTALSPIPGNSFDTYADVTQTLFSFKLGHALRAARIARTAGDEDVRRARQGTALLAIQGYNQLLFAIEQLRVARSTIDQKQGHVDVARNRRAAGAATELEVLRAEVDLENQRAELLRAETQVAASRARLNTVMFRPTETPIEPTDALVISPVATVFDAAVTEALTARPELQALRLEVQVRDRLIDVVRADMKPRVEFNGAYGFSVRRPRNLFDFDFTRWSAGVALTVPLFDGRRTAGRVAQAQADRNIVTQRIAALENEVRLEVQSAWDSLTLADRTLAAADLNVAQARRAAEMTGANYKLGAATPLDVLDAQQSLALAENIRNQALYSHANARASLSFVMGRDPLTDSPTPAGSVP